MNPSFELDAPDHFTAGAVGPPGERVFYLQGRESGRVVTLKCEKEHVRALGEYLAGLLAKLPPIAGALAADMALLEPVDAAWPVGSIASGYDQGTDRIVVIANELVEDDEDEERETEGEKKRPDGATARFLISRAQATAFVSRSRDLMKAGRPVCPMCSQPIDPDGHVCPRSNGHVIARERS